MGNGRADPDCRRPSPSPRSVAWARTEILITQPEVNRGNRAACTQEHRALDPVLEFPDVPGPVVVQQRRSSGLAQCGPRGAFLAGEGREEKLRGGQDVVGAGGPPGGKEVRDG